MKQTLYVLSFLIIFSLFGVQCTFFKGDRSEEIFWENPAVLDLDEIVKRGYIRAIVDNSSTSYYIYKGRRMGYEFEMLRNLASRLGVKLHLVVTSDIQEAFYLLNKGKADIIAMNLETTEERKKYGHFTSPLGQLGTVLVQKKGENRIASLKELDRQVIHIRKDAVYKAQLCKLQEENDIQLSIIDEIGDHNHFVQKILKGEIAFTVLDKVDAMVSAAYQPGLDISLEISPKTDIAWMLRKNAPQLEANINEWIQEKSGSGYLKSVYAKYFQNSNNNHFRTNSSFSSNGGNKISPYDDMIKKAADNIGWDWRLLASLVYKESNFDTTAMSVKGAQGLLQLMPVTLERFGVQNPNDPFESLMGGVNYLKYLDKFWRERIPEQNERIKFILASYNVGQGHVEDAWRLALKYGRNPQNWQEVGHFLKLKTKPEFYKDPVVKSGFAKGHVAFEYVEEVLLLYDSYRTLINP